jgi:hypothetical protein
MNQSFEIKEFKRFCKQNEHIDSVLKTELEVACQNISNETFDFNLKQVGDYFVANDLPHQLILRKLNDNIKRIYKDKQANRKTIISQIITLMEETCPNWIIKTDIKSFYESIDRERLLAKFKDDSILSYYSLYLLDKLFFNSALQSSTGVPRGMNISATLSEIFMRKFDKWVRNYSGVFYYARFVDDIIIFTYSKQSALSFLKVLNENLNEFADGLTINQHKTKLFDGITLEQLNITDGTKLKKDNFLEYLGYKFSKKQEKKITILEISIADKKIKKIKSRITWSFADYIKNTNFDLLENRIQFLTGNYSIKKNAEGNDLRAGIYFNYSQLNNMAVLDELNTYYLKTLYCRNGNFGNKLNSKLTPTNKNQLKKYCFRAGFENKIYYAFNSTQMAEITKCWK